jgi:UDP-N-acetylglucosamine diphosphorylase/glucosamine-1-phosphate N-acetyltransferase
MLCAGRISQPLSETNRLLGSPELLFIEEGASVECSILNTKTGPIYVGKDAEVLEGCMLRGPLAMCEHSVTKMGTKIYGATTLGPHCKVGGEINNSVMFGYSNKGHDGFLGNSVIGEWCNLGADTNNSNLKNNYGIVKIWNYDTENYENTGLQFCGLFMGDHSKSGINTMFNTGTVVGVSANIYGAGFPEKFIPSFSWGGADGMMTYRAEEAIDAAERMMKRRNIELTYEDEQILRTVFEEDMDFRTWEEES